MRIERADPHELDSVRDMAEARTAEEVARAANAAVDHPLMPVLRRAAGDVDMALRTMSERMVLVAGSGEDQDERRESLGRCVVLLSEALRNVADAMAHGACEDCG